MVLVMMAMLLMMKLASELVKCAIPRSRVQPGAGAGLQIETRNKAEAAKLFLFLHTSKQTWNLTMGLS